MQHYERRCRDALITASSKSHVGTSNWPATFNPYNKLYDAYFSVKYIFFSVYMYGCIASTTCIALTLLSALTICPALSHTYGENILSFLVALAVGCLTGDSIFHLLPHVSKCTNRVFIWGRNSLMWVHPCLLYSFFYKPLGSHFQTKHLK